MYQGHSIRLVPLAEDGLVELCFDRRDGPVNKFDDRAVEELGKVSEILRSLHDLRGILVTSAKDVFIVGADIKEFVRKFAQSSAEIAAGVRRSNEVFVLFEDLPVPSVAAINGYALGGGLEFALTCAFRIISSSALVGLPEVKLGLFPGFGGTVRLSRIAGPALASDWIATGQHWNANAALKAGVVDDLAPAPGLRERALEWLRRAVAGEVDWRARQDRKRVPVALPAAEVSTALQTERAKFTDASLAHQPAPLAAIDVIERGAPRDRAGALAVESTVFGEIARSQAAGAMIQTFLNEQAVKKSARHAAKGGATVRRALICGASVAGGSFAFLCASRGIAVRMSDPRPEALEQGMAEARKLAANQIMAGRLPESRGAEVLGSITPQLDYAGAAESDAVIHMLEDSIKEEQAMLAELESQMRPDAVLVSTTGKRRIGHLGASLALPERLVAMHLPPSAPRSRLAEVIRGDSTSNAAYATAVAFAVAVGKMVIPERDCPGFLINRVLTAYIRGFLQLVADGADFTRIDEAMRDFGWTKGPAHLVDAMGVDTVVQISDAVDAAHQDRMPPIPDHALHHLVSMGRLGLKTHAGFYQYSAAMPETSGAPGAGDTGRLLPSLQPRASLELGGAEICDRMMLPLILEAARALEEGMVESAAEIDLAVHHGLDFPVHAGGPLKYADWLGVAEVVARCERLQTLGPTYEPSARLREMASTGTRFY